MGSNPWLAIDVGTAPTLRASELKQAWERFVDDLAAAREEGEDPEVVRATIADSWRRSFAAGVDPSGRRLAPVVADVGETLSRWEEHPLAAALPLVRECLTAVAEEADCLVVISDASGVLLHIEGSPGVRLRAADSMNFAEGALWSEPGAGTNAIGTALAVDHAVQVFAAEHFNEIVQRWTCSAAPIHDPDDGRLLGVIDLTGDLATVHPHSLAVATATAQAVEASLRFALHERDDRLRARYADRLVAGPDPRALVTPSGRVLARHRWDAMSVARLTIPPGGGELTLPSGGRAIAEPVGRDREAFLVRETSSKRAGSGARPLLHLGLLGRDRAHLTVGERTLTLRRRHGEILALLCAHPEGMRVEELCAGLHGDEGSPGSVRVEVSRLRKLIGPWIDTERYRITCDVESDAGRVEGLLRDGAVREAAEAYAGVLLPGSDAPGVVEERERLEGWLRQAVMTADDPDPLWAWVHTPSGCDDLQAWKRLLTHLEFRDPRRSLAAARVRSLRTAFAA
jgi:hypothetical protein